MGRARDLSAPDDSLTPGANQVERFARCLGEIWPDGLVRGERLGLAVSGGPDSCALLLLAVAALPGKVEAATVDHGLRAEAAGEAAQVAHLCERLGVPHRTCVVRVPGGNVQSQARAARYTALAEWAAERGLGAIATAHHADDQAETLLLRLNRASGVAGLAGVRQRGRVLGGALPLLRPLLDWRRAELGAIVTAAGVDPAEDASNLDDRFDRVRLRKALAKADWLDLAAVARSATHLADADAALEWAASREWSECVRKEGFGLTYRPRAPRAIALRVIARIIKELGEAAPRGGSVATAFDTLTSGAPASIGDLVARPGPQGWNFAPAPKRRG